MPAAADVGYFSFDLLYAERQCVLCDPRFHRCPSLLAVSLAAPLARPFLVLGNRGHEAQAQDADI